MLDLYTIPDLFSSLDISGDYEGLRYGGEAFRVSCYPLKDPHAEAEAWLAATTDAERDRLRAKAELRHAAVRKELARSIRSVTREEYLERKRQDMARWRASHPDAQKARQKAWREANREYTRQHMKNYREKRKQNPELAAQDREETRLRMRALRAARKALKPARVLQTKEQKLAKQRAYQAAHPRKLTEEQMQARRDYYRAQYHLKKEQK